MDVLGVGGKCKPWQQLPANLNRIVREKYRFMVLLATDVVTRHCP